MASCLGWLVLTLAACLSTVASASQRKWFEVLIGIFLAGTFAYSAVNAFALGIFVEAIASAGR
ncbi:hypothetical protein [Methylorubrum extorquens]|uniref:hypothetical protein n=1 Tax=Methylorubrum extorquens TaxID=408 RepID=UPI0020A1EC0F|nr:hypothetical protein [Methylorubrum extorquens]MCP1539974.1 hypothetical protein [Methylorubrum extorquens]